jgi:quinol-cytochrome oxidoreductase complex cytochrome b subunit/coenzyme F420-reducing hydrogenase delta subunit
VSNYSLSLLHATERSLSRIFPQQWNPLFSLGALSFYLFWIDAVSGIYLFVFFETSIDGAYQSVQQITEEQWYLGGIMRSLHRYASSAMAVTVTLHLFKELIMKRYVGARWFSWITGVPLLWLLFASAIGGYWLVWDLRAQYIATTTADFLDWLPITTEPMAFGFITQQALSDRFFSLLIFLHIGIPLALLLGMFIHIKRINNSKSNPTLGLGIGFLLALIVLSLVKPATSLAPANLDSAVAQLGMDWFYLNLYPLINEWGAGPVWMLLSLLTILLSLLPFMGRRKTDATSIASVDPEFCNGCSWCYADCPYEAIVMADHSTKRGRQQAIVLADYCVGCGICAGACPSATPFKRVNQLKTGIDLPDDPISDMLESTKRKLDELNAEERIVVFGCSHGTALETFADGATVTVTLPCIGQLPPSFIDYLCKRENVSSVLLTGCASGDCYHRFGNTWLEERIVALREPHVRSLQVRKQISSLWTGTGGEPEIARRLAELRDAGRREDNQ